MRSSPFSPRPSRIRRRAGIAVVTAAALAGTVLAAAPAQAADPVAIQLLGINDFHGRIFAAPSTQLGAIMIGKVNELRAQNPNTVFVSSGDNIGASTFESFIGQDNPTIEVLNSGGLDVSAVGNHEFDMGFTTLLDRIPAEFGGVEDPSQDLTKTVFPYLGANVYAKGTETPVLPEYAIEERAGVTIGFVGLVTEETYSLVSPAGITTLDFGSPLTALNRVAAQLSDGNDANGEADVVVALLHDGSNSTDCTAIEAEDTNFGDLVRGASAAVDVIYSAHTHMAYNCSIGGRPVIQTGSYATNLGQVVLNVDPDTGDVVSTTSGLVSLTAAPLATPDPAVVAIVNAAVAEADVIGAVQVGSITGDIRRAFTAAGAEDRGSESSLGSLVADMQLWATSENPDYAGTEPAVMAFMNPGGLRADLLYAPDGVISYKEAALVQPFANTLVTMNLTGAQIRSVLEEQWQPAGASRPVLRLGISADLSYTYDPSAPTGSHVQSITFKGAPLDEAATYRVVVNSFLAAGGDNFFTLGQGTNKSDSGMADLQGSVAYFAAHPSVSPPALGRSTAVVLPPAESDDLTEANAGDVTAPETARAGEQVVVNVGVANAGKAVDVWLFSDPVLLFSGTVAADGTVTVTLPAGAPAGAHKIGVFTNEDVLIGWAPVLVAGAEDAAVNVVPPSIVGEAYKGATVTADPGQWWPAEGVEFSYQWQRDGKDIRGATRSQYKIDSKDVNRRLSVVVTAKVQGFDPVSAESESVKVTKNPAPAPLVNTEKPEIHGKAAHGAVLWADRGEWSQKKGVTFTFQWNLDGKPIKHAKLQVYQPGKSDVGHVLTVTVTAKAKGVPSVSATSDPVTVKARSGGGHGGKDHHHAGHKGKHVSHYGRWC